ncbi:hypothetical protein PVAP13_4KG033400 [Panicum virgatum]|uniref:Uncharacterized protein n=1 Tax=Panicum virgatum TaxID=38727 RepID=A0A8T0TNB6_PANVG|nr:hypothetical protein PVAP13_4KG033400 [Panicum virgatum]KAG2609390.1 hypothetical protein PVAP13_4KG033400 [Panicum virgatum]
MMLLTPRNPDPHPARRIGDQPMANARRSSDRNPAAAAPPATSGTGHPPWAFAAVPVVHAVLSGAGRAEVAFVAFIFLNLQLLFWSGRRFEPSPPGSAASRRARLVLWALSATFMAAFTWKMTALLPQSFTIVAGAMAAAAMGFAVYVLRALSRLRRSDRPNHDLAKFLARWLDR